MNNNSSQQESKKTPRLGKETFLQISLITLLGSLILYILTDGLWGYAELLEAHEYFLLAAALIGVALFR